MFRPSDNYVYREKGRITQAVSCVLVEYFYNYLIQYSTHHGDA